MKYIIIILSILVLQSCRSYRYDVTYEKCNGQTGSLSVRPQGIKNFCAPDLRNGKLGSTNCGFLIDNVCDFSYTATPLQ